MCWDEYAQLEKALFEQRERRSREEIYVLANRVRMNASQRASAVFLRQRTTAALPPLPPEPYEVRTTFPSDHTTLREHLLFPYYLVLCSILFVLTPIWLPVSIAIACLEKAGLWSYIKKPFQYLVLSPILSAARAVFRPLQQSYGIAVGLSREYIRIALETGISHYIVRSISRTVALLLLPSRTLSRLVHRTTKLASVVLSRGSYAVKCKTASYSCSLAHLRNAIIAMAGFGKKLFYGIVTLVLGFFAVLPLAVYAFITFWLAIGWLSLMILVKGAGVVQRSLKHWWKGDDRNSPEAIAERNRAAALAKREARSRSESFSQSSASTHSRSHSNRSNRSGSSVSLVNLPQNLPQIDRDYEGVGGWLIPRDNNDHNSNAIIDNDNDSRAASSSRRPDATPTTFRRRSFGASSSGINSPEILNTPSLPRHSTSTSLSRQAGSPQSYFINNAPAARSTTSINSRRDSNSRRNSRANRTDGSTE